MQNLYAIFSKKIEISKTFSTNLVYEHGNLSRSGVVPLFSDLEVVSLSLTAEVLSIDSKNHLFSNSNECESELPNFIFRHQFNDRRKQTSICSLSIRLYPRFF